ncbi:MGMT family protein [Haloferula sargassicola]|uniref:Methylated-DNA-[protein]-cysteine S-methyltransferase DNA binding domain-containing protein n=1 Tax=Haloferula sargassicola TaxID=490096 RepID=A0ABP9UMF0_9BACT
MKEDLDAFLDATLWRRAAYNQINVIPKGMLASYGRIAELTNLAAGTAVSARQIAWLRRRLYGFLTHDTEVPLHRVAKMGDVASKHDSEDTRRINTELRIQEEITGGGSWL